MQRKMVTVTVLSGLLGSGKTSVLSNLLRLHKNSLRIGVIVNDFAEVNVDSRLIQETDSSVPMSNFLDISSGCACCTSKGDINSALEILLAENASLDQVIIECSGLANPKNLASVFPSIQSVTPGRVSTVQFITVVDAGTVLSWLKSANHEAPSVPLSLLLVDQIEFADVIVLNKVDRISVADIASCRSAIGSLNPKARIQMSKFGVVSGSPLLPDDRNVAPSGLPEPLPGVTPGLALSSFVYERAVPFHPQRLHTLIRKIRGDIRASLGSDFTGLLGNTKGHDPFLAGVVRSKGVVWVCTSPAKAREWVFAGGVFELQRGPLWPNDSSHSHHSHSAQGSRRQEIVFIGTGKMSKQSIIQCLDACLLTEEETAAGQSEWEKLRDPLILTLSVGERAQAANMPTTHAKACPCCDPELRAMEQLAFSGF